MDHFRMLMFRKRFEFFSQQQRIIGENSLVSHVEIITGNVFRDKCF